MKKEKTKMDNGDFNIEGTINYIQNTNTVRITQLFYQWATKNESRLNMLTKAIRRIQPTDICIGDVQAVEFTTPAEEMTKFLRTILGVIDRGVHLKLTKCPTYVLKGCIAALKWIAAVTILVSDNKDEPENIQLLTQAGYNINFYHDFRRFENVKNTAPRMLKLIEDSKVQPNSTYIHFESIEDPSTFDFKVHTKILTLKCLWNARQTNPAIFDVLKRCVTFDQLEVHLVGYKNLVLEAAFFQYVLNLVKSGYDKDITMTITTSGSNVDDDHFPVVLDFMKYAVNLRSLSLSSFFTTSHNCIKVLQLLTETSRQKCRLRTLTMGIPIEIPYEDDAQLRETVEKFISTTRVRFLHLQIDRRDVNDKFEGRILEAYKSSIHLRELRVFSSWSITTTNNEIYHRERLKEADARQDAEFRVLKAVLTMLAIKRHRGHFIPKEMFQMLGQEMKKMWSSLLPQFQFN